MNPELNKLLTSLRENIENQHKYYNEVLAHAMKTMNGEISEVDKKLFDKLPPIPAPIRYQIPSVNTKSLSQSSPPSLISSSPTTPSSDAIIDLTEDDLPPIKRESPSVSSTNSSDRKRKSSPQPYFTYKKTTQQQQQNVIPKIKTEIKDEPIDLSSLSEEQRQVLDLIEQGKNVFFTGSAGTGKSYLLKTVIRYLRQKYPTKFVAVTASTGCAAAQIEGTTLHAWAGMGVPSVAKDFEKLWGRKEKWRLIDVLIIDEISMVSAELLDGIEAVVRDIRGNFKPFGGVQLIVSGDFFQLPPVFENIPPPEVIRQMESRAESKLFWNKSFCFEGNAWKDCQFVVKKLTKVFRQNDAEFVGVLNQLRHGIVSPTAIKMLNSCSRPLQNENGIEPTQLYALNKDVTSINMEKLEQLPGESGIYHAFDTVELDDRIKDEDYEAAKRDLWNHPFFTQCQAAKEIKLKVGAQVMLLKNLSFESGKSLINGSRGVVTSWKSSAEVIKELERKLREELANAMSEDEEWARIQAEQQISIIRAWNQPNIPVVRFHNGVEQTMLPDMFRAELSGTGVCRRWQIPLKLAWAITIHKCQGLSLDRAKISLKDIFASGHAYVALSRVRSLEGLEVDFFSKTCVKVNGKVLDFYQVPRQEVNVAVVTEESTMKRSESRGGNCCFKCGLSGHWARDCTSTKKVK